MNDPFVGAVIAMLGAIVVFFAILALLLPYFVWRIHQNVAALLREVTRPEERSHIE